MNKKKLNFTDGEILTYEQVFNAQIESIELEDYNKKMNIFDSEHQKFLDTEEWRKYIQWKPKTKEQYAVRLEDNKYEIRSINIYSNNIKDIQHCQANLDALFAHHPLLNTFKYNSFTHKNEYNNDRYDEDTKPAEIFNLFKRNFNEWCPRTDIKEAIQESLNNNTYHPIKDYLNSLCWDGQSRLETFLIDYYNAEDTKLNRVYFKRWMIALIKRIFTPGAKFDAMLVLAGEQGKKKTTLFNWLGTINGVTYYSEAPDNLKDINSLVYSSLGKLIMTFDDFDDICNKGDLGKVKSFITTQDRTAALKWQHDKQYPVTYVLAATTNQYDILVDDATFDERRFWIVKVDPKTDLFDIKDEVKDQLYAEAYYLYQQDVNQRLWIWEQELKDEETELQKTYKKAITDPIVEKVYNIFNRKYNIKDGKFESEEDFIKAVDTIDTTTTVDDEFFGTTESVETGEYIKLIPSSWVINYLNKYGIGKRSTNRIVQILHTQGLTVIIKMRHQYKKGGAQLTCIQIYR